MSLFSKKKLRKIQDKEKVDKTHTIMIVDDEAANLTTLNSLLSKRYNLIEAQDGEEAVRIIDSHPKPEKICLIISDQRMPKMTGTELFEKMLELIPRTKRIILTGYTDVQAITDSINKAQIYKFVLKPFDRNDLLMTVERALEAYDLESRLDDYHRNLEQKIKERTRELEEKNAEILRTQNQLVMQEKMASLGTLTAGIAHELKNPLNFINNFSGISLELFDEMWEELEKLAQEKGLQYPEEVTELFDDLKLNAGQINHNGKRANKIVENMMVLARGGSSERQELDVIMLLEEYVELADHGIQARDEQVVIHQDYDTNARTILGVPQNLSRVIINLLNNANEALQEKKKQHDDFKPSIWVTSVDRGDSLDICIKDNGPGIPDEVLDQVFNPFFTTKHESMNNLGLGLSISFDIIVQEHHGTLRAESELGEWTCFTITLPKR